MFALEGSGSRLPLLGEFLGIFAEIKATASEVGSTTLERQHALISRLNAWVTKVRAMSVPNAGSFLRMLCSTVVRPTQA